MDGKEIPLDLGQDVVPEDPHAPTCSCGCGGPGPVPGFATTFLGCRRIEEAFGEKFKEDGLLEGGEGDG